jgi:hypothetical protein
MKTGSELWIPSKIPLLKDLVGILWRDRSVGTCPGVKTGDCQRTVKAIAVIKQLMQLLLY